MLKILKAELSYARYWIIRVLSFILPLFIYFYLMNRWWMNGIIIMGGMFLAANNIKIRFKEDRLRLETLLPVSLRKIAVLRLIYSTLPIIAVYGFCEIIGLIPEIVWGGWRDSGAERLMFLGLTLFMLFTYNIIGDLTAAVVYKSRAILMEIFKSVVAGIIFVVVAGVVSSVYLQSMNSGLNFIKIIFLLDIILAWISMSSFNNRKSFCSN